MECRRGNRCLLYLLTLLSLVNLLAFVLFADHWLQPGRSTHQPPAAADNNNNNNNGQLAGEWRQRQQENHGATYGNRRHIPMLQAMTTSYDVTDGPNRISWNRIVTAGSEMPTGSGPLTGNGAPERGAGYTGHDLLTGYSGSGLVTGNTISTGSGSSGSPSFVTEIDNMPDIFSIFANFFSGKSSPEKSSKKSEALKAPRLDRLWNVWNVSFTLDKPEVCLSEAVGGVVAGNRSREEVTVMVVVFSAGAHHAARGAIRRTWGRAILANNRSVRLVFFVGRSRDGAVQRALLDEDGRNGDIVQADFGEDYKNLSLKSVLLLRWVSLRCPAARFVFKVDDDVFVNPGNFLSLLQRHRNLKRRIFGRLAARWRPIRDERSHYFVPKTVWTSSIYPDFVAGPAYVVTGDAIGPLLAQVSSVPFFFLEDVYVTGILAQKAGVRRLSHNGFANQRTVLNPCLFHKLVSSHHVNATRMETAWSMLQRYSNDSEACWEVKCSLRVLGLCVERKKTAVNFDLRLDHDGFLMNNLTVVTKLTQSAKPPAETAQSLEPPCHSPGRKHRKALSYHKVN